MKKVENFSQPHQLFGNWPSRIDRFQLKFMMGAHSNSESPSLFRSVLTHPDSKSYTVSFFFFWFLTLQGMF